MEGFDYITNYVFADTLSTRSLAKNLNKGHLYTAFKTLGDANGFNFFALSQSDEVAGIMGDSVKISEVKNLGVVAPLPGQYRLIHNGKVIQTSSTDGYEFSFAGPFEPGSWRIEVHLNINGKYTPWIYSNPVYLY